MWYVVCARVGRYMHLCTQVKKPEEDIRCPDSFWSWAGSQQARRSSSPYLPQCWGNKPPSCAWLLPGY